MLGRIKKLTLATVVVGVSACSLTNGLSERVQYEEVSFGARPVFHHSDCPDDVACGNPSAWPTSIVALLADPDQHEGRVVSVSGFASHDTHGNILFMTSEHCQRSMVFYSLGLIDSHLNDVDDALVANGHCEEVLVEGAFYGIDLEPEPGVVPHRPVPGFIEVMFIRMWFSPDELIR